MDNSKQETVRSTTTESQKNEHTNNELKGEVLGGQPPNEQLRYLPFDKHSFSLHFSSPLVFLFLLTSRYPLACAQFRALSIECQDKSSIPVNSSSSDSIAVVSPS